MNVLTPYRPAKLDRRIKTDSNVRALRAFHTERSAAYRSQFERLAKSYRRDTKGLVSKLDLRTASTTIGALRERSRTAGLESGAESAKWEASRSALRKEGLAALARSVRNFRGLREQNRGFRQELDRLAAALMTRKVPGRLPLSTVPAVPLEPTAREVTTPFALFDVWRENFFDNVRDDSFAIPSIGHVINNVVVSHSANTSVLNGVFGLDDLAHVISRAGCGFNYTVPRAGRLRIVAEVQNFHSRVSLSLEDNFGFSSGSLFANANVFATVVRGSRILELSQTVSSRSISSDGDDVSAMLPTLDDTAPFTFDVTTEESFDAGADVQIIVGSEFLAATGLDDMKASVNALLWSQVRKVSVDVV